MTALALRAGAHVRVSATPAHGSSWDSTDAEPGPTARSVSCHVPASDRSVTATTAGFVECGSLHPGAFATWSSIVCPTRRSGSRTVAAGGAATTAGVPPVVPAAGVAPLEAVPAGPGDSPAVRGPQPATARTTATAAPNIRTLAMCP